MVSVCRDKVSIVFSFTHFVYITQKATMFLHLPIYGNVMVGDVAFEFYKEHHVNQYIQIPWSEIKSVEVSVLWNGKWIPRFTIYTNNHGTYRFSTKQVRNVLKVIQNYIGINKMYRSVGFFTVIKRRIVSFFQ